MASFIFKLEKGIGDQKQLSFRQSTTNVGLPKRQLMYAKQIQTLEPLPPNTFPEGSDTAPVKSRDSGLFI